MSTTIITLLQYDEEPMSRWPFGLTMNAVVSIFSMIISTAMIVPITTGISQLKVQKERPLQDMQTFDEASQGSWGSVSFIQNKMPVSFSQNLFGCWLC